MQAFFGSRLSSPATTTPPPPLRPALHAVQKVMDAHISALLAGAPRRSAVFVDSDVAGEDGG